MIGTEDAIAVKLFGDTTPTGHAPEPQPATLIGDARPATRGVSLRMDEPAPTSAPAQVGEHTSRSEADVEQALYGELELPQADPPKDDEGRAIRKDAVMYGMAEAEKGIPDESFMGTVGQQVKVGDNTVQITEAIAKKALVETRTYAAELGLNKSEITSIGEAMERTYTAQPDQVAVISNREQAVELLNSEHGNDAALSLRAAQIYIAKRPRLAAMLERTGAGDDPQVVTLIARKALALHKAGRLSVPNRRK